MSLLSQQLPSIELWCHEGSSDKLYRVAIVQSGDGYHVNFAYGRRGTALNTGTKNTVPLPYSDAQDIYTKLVKSKKAKGYKAIGETGDVTDTRGSVGTVAAAATAATVGTVDTGVAESDRSDTGLRPQLLNPITEEETQHYLANDRWCMQEKYDGRRLLVRKGNGKLVPANRKGQRISLSRPVELQLAGLPGDFVLDGELVGEVYHVFDLLEASDGDWRQMPYRDRLAALQRLVGGLGGNVLTVPTATECNNKQALLRYLRSANKEGVVFKDLDAPWSAGRPASGGTQFKCKFWTSCSCIVSGVNAKRSIQVSLDDTFVGNVTIPPNAEVPDIGQVVEVRYLYVAGVNGSLYQPIYQGVRDDIDASECTALLQCIKYKPATEAA